MSYSDVTVSDLGDGTVEITARGGTRRQRAAAIIAEVRKRRSSLLLHSTSYSETHGFQTATYARYRSI